MPHDIPELILLTKILRDYAPEWKRNFVGIWTHSTFLSWEGTKR